MFPTFDEPLNPADLNDMRELRATVKVFCESLVPVFNQIEQQMGVKHGDFGHFLRDMIHDNLLDKIDAHIKILETKHERSPDQAYG